VLAGLRLGVYELVYVGGTPARAAVNESVELVKGDAPHAHAFANAILRRASQEAPALLAALDDLTAEGAAVLHSHPLWIAERWWNELGAPDARALMARDNEPAENAVRANELRTTTAELVELLGREGVKARADRLVPEAVVLSSAWDVHGSAPFERGLLMPQSRASMLVSRELDPRPGERVLDLCAAPGAKSSHLAALMRDDGRVVAVELDPARAAATRSNCERLGATCVEVVVGDATQPDFGDGYDRALVDPPCSDLGTLQSRPDARWRKTPAQVEELIALQRRILDAAAEAIRPGGRLVFSTCTISEAENGGQMQDFLARHPNFRVCDQSDRNPELARADSRSFLQTLPHREGTDGFFIAALERTG
jgi:16S rRNA (cytosine967-C5)-methyltransferase